MPHEGAVDSWADADETDLLFEAQEKDRPAGATVERVLSFLEAGEYDLARYMPSHYAAGW